MSVSKKSLISNRPTEKKVTIEPAKETASIGESKALQAKPLAARKTFKSGGMSVASFKRGGSH